MSLGSRTVRLLTIAARSIVKSSAAWLLFLSKRYLPRALLARDKALIQYLAPRELSMQERSVSGCGSGEFVFARAGPRQQLPAVRSHHRRARAGLTAPGTFDDEKMSGVWVIATIAALIEQCVRWYPDRPKPS